MQGYEWVAQRGRSVSTQIVSADADSGVVIDGVEVDPITPNMAFNVYFSTDDSGDGPNMTETNWEQKLWTRVPDAYVCTQKQQYVFPDPIVASYVKLEFVNLPAQTYTPGTFQGNVSYKKFPTWVADYFIVQLEQPSFVANLVNVQNDALNFAYSYYLDDLDQDPASPVAAPSNVASTLSSYFSQSDASQLVDSATLAQINLVMNSYQVPTGSIVDPSTMAGAAAQNAINSQPIGSSTFEVPSVTASDNSIVSTLQREPVIFEQSLPVMFFFVTCRHTYMQATATFDYNKAYFAGTNSVTFLRSSYATSTDSSLYIEAGVDTQNAQLNDFVIDSDSDWYCYDPA